MRRRHKKIPALAAAAFILILMFRRRVLRFSFNGKVIVITGGSRGLGFALARRLVPERVNLALIARDELELESAKAKLLHQGSIVTTWPCDVSNETELRTTIEQIGRRLGRIDVLINNAGEIVVGPFDAMTRDDFERALNIHFWAPLTAIWSALPYLQKAGRARVINITSFSGRVAVPHLTPYCVSKFALAGLSDALRAELATKNIVVTTVAPGLMRTGSHKNALFKGAHRQEFSWFSLGAANPLISVGANRAARQILDAARRQKSNLTITFPARAVIFAQAVFPNCLARIMKLVARLLPRLPRQGGSEIHTGWQSESKLSPSILTILADRATERYNERSERAPETE